MGWIHKLPLLMTKYKLYTGGCLTKPNSCIRNVARGRWVCWKNFIAAPLNV